MPISNLTQLMLRLLGRPFYRPITASPGGRNYLLNSASLGRKVSVDVYLPSQNIKHPLRLFCFNDGQDLRQMPIAAIMEQLIAQEGHPPFIIVGIHANENRMREYGTLAAADYAGRGDLASQHAIFVLQTLLPFLERQFGISQQPAHRAYAGFSLGALPAFDLPWHYPKQFGIGGIFSGALWWRSTPFDAEQPDANRILQTQVETAIAVPVVRYWFQAGTLDEQEDRNNNGIIDAIDDTLDLIQALEVQGFDADHDLKYVEVEGGKHEPATWAAVLPDFLKWGLRE